MPFPFSYLFWYYTGGFISVFRIFGNYLRYTWRLFSIRDLLVTLVFPWKRDITPKDWRGFDPLKSAERFLWNLISRMMGAIVRTLLIVLGLAALVIVLAVGLVIIIVWVCALPIFLLFAIQAATRTIFRGEAEILLVSAGVVVLTMLGYLFRLPKSFLPKDRRDLFRKSYFSRVLARLGIMQNDFHAKEWLSDEAFENQLARLNMTKEEFDAIVSHEAAAAERRSKRARPWLWENMRRVVPIGRGWEYGYTPKLDRYSSDLSETDYSEYRRLHLFGRDDELHIATLVLARSHENSIILVGDTGIGKRTFVHALARKIREGDIPAFEHFRFLIFDLGIAVGDAINRGEDVENALRSLFAQATIAGNVVLVIENIDTYLSSSNNPAHLDLSPVFAEFLALPSFRVIATVGTAQYHRIVQEDDPVVQYFEAIHLREPNADTTLHILLDVLEPEERRKPLFTWKALEKVVAIAGEYNWDVAYPEKAIDLAQEVILYSRGNRGASLIVPETVVAFVSMKTGVPVGSLDETEKERLLRLEELLHHRIVGQNEAIRQVSEALRRARAGFGNPKRPLGSFLFLGPTGVGKTETAKALAEAYFGDETRMVRIDMSEFQGPDAAERLIGSNVSGEQGVLTEAIRGRPYSVVLLDEIEKAYPRALDIFLQIVDEGFVTDGYGKKVNFRKTIIIATSNAASGLIAEVLEQGIAPEDAKKTVIDEIVRQNIFRMEFMNRFDGIIFFAPLSEGELMRVATFKLEALAGRIKKEKNITLSFDPNVIMAVVKRGYEPGFGARSLNRYIEDHIEDVIVRKVLEGSITEGGSIVVTIDDLE